MLYGSDPFEKDHRRLLENAATLSVSSLSQPISLSTTQKPAHSTDGKKDSIH